MTHAVPPDNTNRFPLLLACRPSPANITPALTSSSLNLPMSASSFSLGITPASEFFVALTITMTRIVVLLLFREDGSVDDDRQRLLLEWRRTSLRKIDTRGDVFCASGVGRAAFRADRGPSTTNPVVILDGYGPWGRIERARSGASPPPGRVTASPCSPNDDRGEQ